jgi:hypothetical protein
MERTHILLSLLWEVGYKVSKKKAQIYQNTVKYLSFHLSRGNAGLALKGNRLYVPSQTLRPTGKLGSFGELQVYVESGSLTTLSWPNPSMKPQSRENGNLWYGGESKRKPLKKSRRHSPMPLL